MVRVVYALVPSIIWDRLDVGDVGCPERNNSLGNLG